MEVAILEMPLDGHHKVRLDGAHLDGHISRIEKEGEPDAWAITMIHDGVERTLKRESVSRESAAFLMLHHHFELEVRGIRKGKQDADS